MIKIDNRLPFTVASTPTAGAFCITPHKQHKSAPNYRDNTGKPTPNTTTTGQLSITPTHLGFLPTSCNHPASFKPT
ncbi:MAG: hypothetical protein JSW10_05690 [Pseudomonadota bacterium]|nr:MAG: hypothetical protein JSW10_05690 [Pseudomonadota bacterium]